MTLSSLIEANCGHWPAYQADLDASGDGSKTEPHYLAISDSSSLDWSGREGELKINDPDLGPLERRGLGFFVHPTLLVESRSGFPLGLSDIHIWNRPFEGPDRHERNYRLQSFNEKESFKWAEGIEASRKRLAALKGTVTYVMDREADIYELFAHANELNEHFLVRCCRDRAVNYQGARVRLYDLFKTIEIEDRVTISIQRSQKRKARQATFEIQFVQIELSRPLKRQEKHLPDSLPLWCINLRERPESVPPNEEPIHWVLWTTHRVDKVEKAREVIQWYRFRWVIEDLFGGLKSRAMGIEESQLETGIGLKKLTVMALQTALRILQLTKGRDGQPELPASLVFDAEEIQCLDDLVASLEGKTEKQKNPYRKHSLAWAAWIIGRLGGWKGYKSEGPPGQKTMAWGLERFNDIKDGWTLARNLRNPK